MIAPILSIALLLLVITLILKGQLRFKEYEIEVEMSKVEGIEQKKLELIRMEHQEHQLLPPRSLDEWNHSQYCQACNKKRQMVGWNTEIHHPEELYREALQAFRDYSVMTPNEARARGYSRSSDLDRRLDKYDKELLKTLRKKGYIQ